MLSRFVPALAGVAMAATVGSAFAFDAEIVAPKALRTRPSPRAAVIMVIPAQRRDQHGALRSRMVRGGLRGPDWVIVYTPVLVSAAPAGLAGRRRPTGNIDRAARSAVRSDRRRSRRRGRVPRRGRRGGPLMLGASRRPSAGGGREAGRGDVIAFTC